MATNMYRVGDYVYFDVSTSLPYVIRRIEELNKTSSGNVEAKVTCFYRRRDLPPSLIHVVDKHQSAGNDEPPVALKFKKMCLKAPAFDENPMGFLASYEQTNTGAFDELDEATKEDNDTQTSNNNNINNSSSNIDYDLNSKQKHQIKHRELFLSRQTEILPAIYIRGRCSVTLFNETESLQSYFDKEDMFFYCQVFDPVQKTLSADKGEIRVGSKYQCEVMPWSEDLKEKYDLNNFEKLVWTSNNNLSDKEIDQFLLIARSVGTFARALDCNSSVKQPSLHMSAAASSRDVTLFHAMDTLHKNSYNLSNAMCSLVPTNGPVLCRDQMEEWSASEANIFEEGLEKCGKDFYEIRQDFLPWKTIKSIVEYYYMWKTTDRYVQQKRIKAVEADAKLKQVFIPDFTKMNTPAMNENHKLMNGNIFVENTDANPNGKACESCNGMISSHWYSWGPSNMQCRLCETCWFYWKRYGGLKVANRIETEINEKSNLPLSTSIAPLCVQNRPFKCSFANCGRDFKYNSHLCRHYFSTHGIMMRSGSPRAVTKTRHSFTLITPPLIRISRKLCCSLINLKHAARTPAYSINMQAIRQEIPLKLPGKTAAELRSLLLNPKKNRGSVTEVANRIGRPNPIVPNWLILTDRAHLPKPEIILFPRPPKGPDGSLLYEKVPNKPEADKIPLNIIPNFSRKRHYDEINGFDGHTVSSVPPKRVSKDSSKQLQKVARDQFMPIFPNMNISQHLPRHISQMNGKQKIAHFSRSFSNRKNLINWMDAPDDVFFKSSMDSKSLRKSINSVELKRAARKPWRPININKLFPSLQISH